MQTDIKQKQPFWETPRNLMIVTGAIAAGVAALAASVGYKLAQTQAALLVLPFGYTMTITAPPAKP
jgi:hypothetical protein